MITPIAFVEVVGQAYAVISLIALVLLIVVAMDSVTQLHTLTHFVFAILGGRKQIVQQVFVLLAVSTVHAYHWTIKCSVIVILDGMESTVQIRYLWVHVQIIVLQWVPVHKIRIITRDVTVPVLVLDTIAPNYHVLETVLTEATVKKLCKLH